MFAAMPKKPKAITDGNTSGNSPSSSPSSAAVMDIEDSFGGGGKGPGRPIVHTSRRRRGGRRVNHDQCENDDIDAMDIDDEENSSPTLPYAKDSPKEEKVVLASDKESFDKWLSARKKQWREARKERKRLLNMANNGGNNTSVGAVGAPGGPDSKRPRRAIGDMQSYVRDAAAALQGSDWQVLEVRELSSSESKSPMASSNGEFILWVMVGNDTLQKVHVTVPRTVYVDCRGELQQRVDDIISVKRVEKHLPHNKSGNLVYEVTLPEGRFRSKDWTKDIVPADSNPEEVIQSVYGMGTSLMLRALMDLGCVSRVNRIGMEANKKSKGKSYALSHLSSVSRPSGGEYLHRNLSYRRVFLYESLHPRNKTGLIAVFVMDGGSGKRQGEINEHDLTRPADSKTGSLELNATCHLWVVKPGSSRGQKNVSAKQCETMFAQIMAQLNEMASADESSEYACLAPSTKCTVDKLSFVDTESDGYARANEVLNSYSQGNHGPTLLMTNVTKPLPQLRKAVPSCSSFPLVTMPFPPGPQHNPSLSSRPALNWEPLAVQLCLEAYLYNGVISFPKRVMASRYGNVPIGNLGRDETVTLYDVSYGRLLQKSRAVLWANEIPGIPDLGINALSLIDGGSDELCGGGTGANMSSNELFGDDDELISPVIRRPGAYRCICVEIDVHDLSIAALTDLKLAAMSAVHSAQENGDASMFGGDASGALVSSSAPLGDEMSTAVSLPLLRALVQGWLHDAFGMNSIIADDLLHNFYRLVCTPEAALNDPALHRIVHSLMKTTFLRLLGEFQRLGSTIICGTFNKIIIATNKTELFDAREYVDFVISTIQKRSGGVTEGGLGRIALRPNNYYSDYIFLDENNFGGIHFEQREIEDDDEAEWAMRLDENGDEDPDAVPIIPTVVSGWNIMHFLASEIAQEYFRAIIGRFSKDVYRKQVQIKRKEDSKDAAASGEDKSPASVKDLASKEDLSADEQLVRYKRKLISKHFSSYLTRALGEIMKDGGGAESFPKLPGSHLKLRSPPLEFVKNILVLLELDPDVEHDVAMLKKSLFAQVGVQEYSGETKWQNPATRFVLPDVFCTCGESRDLDLCAIVPSEDGEGGFATSWMCLECDTEYDREDIERRLVDMVQRNSTRYQLQDLRDSKSGRVAIKAMAKQSEASAPLKLDISRKEMSSQIRTLHNLAHFYDLPWLRETTEGALTAFDQY